MAEKIIQNPSITSGSFTIDDGKIVAIAGMPLAGSGGGTQSDFVYVPSFNNETGDISFILGVTGTEGKGPWHISGTPGPKGEDGAQGEPGNDACPITATSAEVDDGVHVTISYTSGGNALTEFDILDGYDGNDGKTPEFSANPVNAHLLWKYSGDSNWTDFGFAMSGEKGPQGETGPQGLSGADGKEGPAGYSPQVTTASVNNDATHNNGGTEINITYKDDDSILTAKYTAWNGNNGEGATIALNGKDGIAISNNGSNYYAGLSADYLAAVQSVSSKLTKTSADTLYQPIGTYALKSEIPTKVTDLNDSANYVVTGDILTGTGNKLTGIKIGSTSYTVPTTDLSNYYTKSETSGATEITNALSTKLDSTAATQTYQTKSDMANYLTTSDAANTYQPKGNYAPETVTATINTLTAASASWNEVSAKLGTAQYANDSATFVTKPDTTQTVLNNNYLIYSTLTDTGATTGWMPLSANYYSKSESDGRYQKKADMSSYLTTAQYETDSATFVTSSSNTITGTKQYALTTAGWAEVSTPTIPDITANNGISANGHTIGIDNTNLVTNTQYAWTTTGWSDIGLSNYLPLSGGTVSGDVIVKSTGNNLLAVNTSATLMGQSRVANLTDTTAIGTNWLGVNSNGGGFLKNVQGGNVGALNGTSIQIDFAPNGNTAYGNITVNSQGNESKVVHVPTASYNSMSSFDNTNGPNYMLRKTASGFDIGAAVINVTALPATTEANAYYFVYDV